MTLWADFTAWDTYPPEHYTGRKVPRARLRFLHHTDHHVKIETAGGSWLGELIRLQGREGWDAIVRVVRDVPSGERIEFDGPFEDVALACVALGDHFHTLSAPPAPPENPNPSGY